VPQRTAHEDVVRRAFLASNRGDTGGFLDCLAPDVEWQSAGLFLFPAQTYRGREQVRSGLANAEEQRGARPHVTLRELSAKESTVLVTGAVTVPSSRRTMTVPVAWLIDVRDGALARVRTFRGEDRARAEWQRPRATGATRSDGSAEGSVSRK
jgi:ketosteroid isomerase-like protein